MLIQKRMIDLYIHRLKGEAEKEYTIYKFWFIKIN